MPFVSSASEEQIALAAETLRRGGLVAFPTETVYGLGGNASNDQAIRAIYAAKGRPANHPLIVHFASEARAFSASNSVSDAARALAARFWPGPLTLVLPKNDTISPLVTGGQSTVAVRVPNHPVALALLSACDFGVAAPSANRFGRVSTTTAEAVRAELGDAVDQILDGGPCAVGVESTIVDCSTSAVRILRPGGITSEQVFDAVGRDHQSGAKQHAAAVPAQSSAEEIRVPGALASHYAPRARVALCAATEVAANLQRAAQRNLHVGLLGPLPDGADVKPLLHFDFSSDVNTYAHRLYAALRAFDDVGCDLVIAVPPQATGLGEAIHDRLNKAAAPRDFEAKEVRS